MIFGTQKNKQTLIKQAYKNNQSGNDNWFSPSYFSLIGVKENK